MRLWLQHSRTIKEGLVIVAAILACEIGFWVVLAAGLGTRYLLRRRRLGAALLACVPLVDVVLLALTVADLRSGARAEFAHGLAALYLGFSVAFGHAMVAWADVRFAHRFAGGPPPERKAAWGTRARARGEWRDFGRAALAGGIGAVLLLGAIALVGRAGDTTELRAWFPVLGTVLLVWLIGPAWASARVVLAGRRVP